MIFTAYFDESGTHDSAEISALAGFVGDARQWRKFEKRAGKLFDRFRVDVFHTIDVRRTDKDFEGWKVDRKIEFLDEFQHIINGTLESGVSSFIRRDDYKYYLGLNWPKGTRRDSKYGILFRGCLSQIIDTIGHIPQTREPRLHIVLEDGHKNAEDAVRIYNWAQGRLGQSRALAGPTFANKTNCLPLAAADLFAYTAWGAEVGQKSIGTPKKPTKSQASYRGNMFHVRLNRDSLDSLHEQAIVFANPERRGVEYGVTRYRPASGSHPGLPCGPRLRGESSAPGTGRSWRLPAPRLWAGGTGNYALSRKLCIDLCLRRLLPSHVRGGAGFG